MPDRASGESPRTAQRERPSLRTGQGERAGQGERDRLAGDANSAARPSAEGQPPKRQSPKRQSPKRQSPKRQSARAMPGGTARPVRAPRKSPAATSRDSQSAAAAIRTVKRLPRRVKIVSGSAIVGVLAVAGVLLLAPEPSHLVLLPATLGSYVKQPATASTSALQLRHKIVAEAAGDVRNVVAAVYERTTGPDTSNGPQVILFIGGNLSGGSSADSLIGGITAQLRGSFTLNSGKLGGQEVCAPGSDGGLVECAWADNDTFGVIVSATMNASALAAEMQQMRPLVEHVEK